MLSSLHGCITRFFFPPFPFLFLFLLPSERPPIGFGGGRRLCGIIMGSSWENCPWKGLSEKEKKERRKIWSCFRSFSETFIRALLLFGGEQSTHWLSCHCHCQDLLSRGPEAPPCCLTPGLNHWRSSDGCASGALCGRPWSDGQLTCNYCDQTTPTNRPVITTIDQSEKGGESPEWNLACHPPPAVSPPPLQDQRRIVKAVWSHAFSPSSTASELPVHSIVRSASALAPKPHVDKLCGTCGGMLHCTVTRSRKCKTHET
ncbi:uncharacterized protein LOC118289014 isoform X2 [Scophthalmus maximus]|uniref:uncharacterized protein LOC118289014 isoform X2 n=1 Tax=Scophthalmus maximus TaxID=52904 RepID=UPI001FA8D94D|nr:uncharacterized protein LOC118289014 isoform X2 [Scophthalmus maximus]